MSSSLEVCAQPMAWLRACLIFGALAWLSPCLPQTPDKSFEPEQPQASRNTTDLRLDAALPSASEVQAALAEVRKDPNMPRTRKERSLQLKRSHEVDQAPAPATEPAQWFVDLLKWINQAGRLVVWALGAIALAIVLVGLRHWVKVRGDQAAPRRPTAPSHVRDLDIRPESLPDEIGASAWSLWQGGDHRSALSLLYRGALSRLVHRHKVPITSASTEGDCLRLAAPHLSPQAWAYTEQLVQAWLLAVYGQRLPANVLVQALCEGFEQHLAAAPGLALATQEAT